MVLFGSAPKPMPWRAFGWHPHTSCHLLASNFRWEAKLGRGPGESSLKVLIALRSPFPFPFWQPDVLGWSQLPCPTSCAMCMYMTWLGKVPGNFTVFPGKTWSRKGKFTCHHTWKSSGLSSLILLLVSCGLWWKWSLKVNWCSCSMFLPLMDSFRRKKTWVCCFHKDSHLVW